MTHMQSIKSKTAFSPSGSFAAVAMLMASTLASCDGIWAKDAYTALQIKQAQSLADDCVIPGEPTSTYKPDGMLDVALPDGVARPYKLPLSILNAMAAVGKNLAEEMNNVTLESFTVELSGDWYNNAGVAASISWSDLCPQRFDYPMGTLRMDPGQFLGVRIDAMQSGHAACLRQLPLYYAEVTAKITAKGRHGGSSIQSAPFKFVIKVCKGCLQTDYTNPEIASLNGALPQCASLVTNPYLGGCFIGQDKPILCCSKKAEKPASSDILCPAMPMGNPDAGAP